MSIKLRFILLLGLLLGGLLLARWAQQRAEASAATEWLAARRQARMQSLQHWIEFSGRTLPQFVADLAQAEDFAPLLAGPSPEKISARLAGQLGAAGLDTLWLIQDDGRVALAISAAGRAPPPLPLAPADLLALLQETPAPRFFAEAGSGLIEVCVRRIHPARPGGATWLAAARRWDAAHLRALTALSEARISLRPPHEAPPIAADATSLALQRPLLDWQGHPLRTLVLEAQETEVAEALHAADRETGLFLLFGIFLIAATALALHQWIVRPLARISASLAGDDPAPLAPLEQDRSEFGRVARLALAAFAQRRALRTEVEQRTQAQAALERSEAALRHNLEERARLGRDLHDGVIQSLYAAGMGLAGMRSLLRVEQAEAAARLEQTRAVLNDTIHDVRNFIHGLEPEALRLQTFAQAIAALLELMRSHRDFQSRVDIADDLARRLTLAQRVHALQIAREAVSNALRHSSASEITLTLGRTGNLIEFAVCDNGSGFDSSSGVAPGTGLENFAQRARELGAELSVHSSPGAGTRVKLCLPVENL